MPSRLVSRLLRSRRTLGVCLFSLLRTAVDSLGCFACISNKHRSLLWCGLDSHTQANNAALISSPSFPKLTTVSVATGIVFSGNSALQSIVYAFRAALLGSVRSVAVHARSTLFVSGSSLPQLILSSGVLVSAACVPSTAPSFAPRPQKPLSLISF
jgi:hypothetical protein